MRVIIVAGGTGGHIYPAIAIINKIMEMEPDSKILYIGTTNRMEKDIIPNMGIEYVGIEMSGLDRKNILSNFSVLLKYKKAVKKAKNIIKSFHPDIVVGAGGYITVPVLNAAHKLKIKILIHEQNSIPGVSNKYLSRFADCICISLPKSAQYFNKRRVVYTGNPRSEEIIRTRMMSKKSLGFDSTCKLVVIVMGSLGSTTMTKKIKELIPGFKDKNYQVVVVTGQSYFDQYQDVNIPDNVKLVPFLDHFIQLLKDTDLIISRAGASTIAEITAIGLPAILVPSPYVTNNHQYKNALELEEAGACTIVTEEEFTKDKLILEIDKLFDNRDLYCKMKNSSKTLGVRDSATKVYEEIRKLIG